MGLTDLRHKDAGPNVQTPGLGRTPKVKPAVAKAKVLGGKPVAFPAILVNRGGLRSSENDAEQPCEGVSVTLRSSLNSTSSSSRRFCILRIRSDISRQITTATIPSMSSTATMFSIAVA